MTMRSLAPDVTLDRLKRDAKALLKALKAGDPASASRVSPYFSDIAAIGLQDAQLVIAREYGFSSWTKLKLHVERGDVASEAPEQRLNRFLSLACVSYRADIAADPARFREAAELLAAHPALAQASVHSAAACGDAAALRHFLKRDPRLADLKGGPFDWTPLLYAAYARLPGRSSLPAARLLVERGADVNAFWLDGGQYRFTVLTGVFGEGEAGRERQPAHPDWESFARLLLDAGADPNDSQALYNRMFEPNNSCLALLIEYGLTARDCNNWLVREDGRFVANSRTVFDYQLAWALKNRMASRVRLLVAHGADLQRPVDGRTPYEWAMLGGDGALAAFLVENGADQVTLAVMDRLAGALLAADAAAARSLVASDATLVAQTEAAHPDLLHTAAGDGDGERVALIVSLGFDVNRMTSRTPLHEAALHGHLAIVRQLIAAGANAALRDPHHHAPPVGWALYNGHGAVADYLKTQALDIFAAAALDMAERVAAMIDAEPDLIDQTFGTFRGHDRPDPESDWLTPLGFAAEAGAASVVELLLSRGANPKLRSPSGERLLDRVRRSDSSGRATALIAAAVRATGKEKA